MSNFWLRAITGTVFVGVLVGSMLLGGKILFAVLGIFAVLGLNEFYQLFQKSKYQPNKIGLVFGAAIYASLILPFEYLQAILVTVVLLLFSIIALLELFRNKKNPFQNIALTILGIVYVILPFSLLYEIGFHKIGHERMYLWQWVLSVFVLVWCNDTFAYLFGRALGKNKLFERISPKKTWEGFIGGILMAILAAFLMAYFFELDTTELIVYGLIVGVIGTGGDLVQSMLKRSLGVKDSGNILPGHGGILDRFDGVIFVIPIIFYLHHFLFPAFA